MTNDSPVAHAVKAPRDLSSFSPHPTHSVPNGTAHAHASRPSANPATASASRSSSASVKHLKGPLCADGHVVLMMEGVQAHSGRMRCDTRHQAFVGTTGAGLYLDVPLFPARLVHLFEKNRLSDTTGLTFTQTVLCFDATKAHVNILRHMFT